MTQSQASPADRLGAAAASVLRSLGIDWLWPGRFALGKLGLIVGDPDTGKSLVTLDMAARVSRGTPWPDGSPCPQGRALIITAEDDLQDTIRPRLAAAGADLDRVDVLGGAGFWLDDHREHLDRWLYARRDTRLVVFDPLAAFMPDNNNRSIRWQMTAIASLARLSGMAMVGIVHLNKRNGGKAVYRASGGLAFVAAARHVYLVSRDPEDRERRVVARIKNNVAGADKALAFRIAAEGGQPAIAWEPQAPAIDSDAALAARALARTDEASLNEGGREADQWLASALAAGPQPARELRRLAQLDGMSWNGIVRAKARLGVTADREGFGIGSKWIWQLPKVGCQK